MRSIKPCIVFFILKIVVDFSLFFLPMLVNHDIVSITENADENEEV